LNEVRKELSEVQNIELDKFIFQATNQYCDAEKRFFDLVFSLSDQEGLTKENAKLFIDYLGNLRLYQLGLLSAEEVGNNPLEWIDYILTGSTHTNFFESRVVDYSHNGLSGKVDYNKYLSSINNT
jgi:ribonucleotide reductase beta subunit family protein with ferritin-like domain